MKFDCFFINTETVIRNAKVYAVPSEPFSPMSFAILRDADKIRLLFYNHRESHTHCQGCDMLYLSASFSPISFAIHKRLLMKFDCFFIISETVIRNAEVAYAFSS